MADSNSRIEQFRKMAEADPDTLLKLLEAAEHTARAVLGARYRILTAVQRHPVPVARACVALLSDWFPATTGEMVHVDGGYHAMGV